MEENNASRIGQVQSSELKQQFGKSIPSIAGKILDCARFVGSAFPYPQISSNPFFDTKLKNLGTGFALAGWLNMVSAPVLHATNFPSLSFFDGGGGSLGNIFISILGDGVNAIQLQGNDDFGTSIGGPLTNPITLNNWFFFRTWFDVSIGACKLQIDNGIILVGSGVGLRFGASASGSITIASDAAGYELRADEIGLWMPALTDDQANLIYNAGVGKTCCPFA